MKSSATGLMLLTLGALLTHAGCSVPQRPGRGQVMHRVEPSTRMGYFLYLPEDYVARQGEHPSGRRWPVVLTIHGMVPYDTASYQIREWQEEADRYGFIAIAPEFATCDSFMQYPLHDPTLPYVQRDDRGLTAVMDEVFRLTNADPNRVLATSFSCGGYLAHYFVNKHPERFACLAVRGSNFNRDMLSAAQLSQYREMPIGIFFGQNDFKACRTESYEAVEWYRRNGFDVEAKIVSGLGHERRPQLAAALFARHIGVNPKTPPNLGAMVMMDVSTSGPRPPARARAGHVLPTSSVRETSPPSVAAGSTTPPPLTSTDPRDRDVLFNRGIQESPPVHQGPTTVEPTRPPYRTLTPTRTSPQGQPTPRRSLQPYAGDNRPPTSNSNLQSIPPTTQPGSSGAPLIPSRIRVDGETVGTAPMWVTLTAVLPMELRDRASVLWTHNDIPISSNGLEARAVLREPGRHTITAYITTADNRYSTARQVIQVVGPSSQPAGS